MTAEAPGLTEKDLQRSLSGSRDVLLLRREKKPEEGKARDDKGWVHEERYYGSIQRSIPLPCGAKLEKDEAKVKNGVLHVTIAKLEGSLEAKRITVNSDQRHRQTNSALRT